MLAKPSLFFFMFLFLITPLVRIGSGNLNTLILVSGPALVLFVYGFHRSVSIEMKMTIFFPLLLSLIYFICHSIFHQFADITILKMLFYSVMQSVSGIAIFGLYRKIYRENAFHNICKDMCTIGAINVVIMIVFFTVPSSVGLANRLFNLEQNLKFTGDILSIYRVNGIGSYGGATLSVLFSILLVIEYSINKNKATILGSVKLLLLCFGIMLSGRTGLFMILYLILLLVFMNFHRILHIIRIGSVFQFIGATVVLTLFIGLISNLDYMGNMLRRTFEFYYSFAETGLIETDTTTALLATHFKFPDRIEGLLLGIGNFGRSEFMLRLDSDPGVIRTIWGGGVIGLFFLLLPIAYIMLFIRQIGDKKIRFIAYWVCSSTLVLSFKEMFFLGTQGISQCLIILLCYKGFEHMNGKRPSQYAQ